MKKILPFFIVGLLLLSKNGLSLEDSLRVVIKKNIKSCRLLVKGDYRVQLPFTEEELDRGRNLKTDISVDNSKGIRIGGSYYNVFAVEVLPQKDGAIYVDSRPYRGKMRFIKKDGSLAVVNIISLEDYLKGVLEYEVAHWWPMESLKAQAVAARTYALYMKEMNKNKSYDLTSDVLSQVYGGKLGERWRIKRAVLSTEGLILMYGGNVLPTFYHSTCGGHTDDVKHLWKMETPPLGGVSCDFCRYSKHYRWDKKIKVKDFKAAFSKSGYNLNNIDKIFVKERYGNDYVKTIEIFADSKEYLISAKEFRSILGADIIRSRLFALDKIDGVISIRGYGWGHGIGLCQWGAYGMSKKGYDFREILEYYYPGSEIKKIIWDEK
ncbi:MAG: SpoIID/LytB domain-containing protein [Candidatus Kaelpia aquatica]|nr:SpoIID/LytB domain-containing protein [Candidatus Kaelpia aquatica]